MLHLLPLLLERQHCGLRDRDAILGRVDGGLHQGGEGHVRVAKTLLGLPVALDLAGDGNGQGAYFFKGKMLLFL